jgi:hypothetical protein
VKVPAIGEIGGSLRHHPARVAVGVVALGAIALIALRSDGVQERAEGGAGTGDLLAALRATVPLPNTQWIPEPSPDVPGPRYAIARVRPGEEIELRDEPEGEVVERLDDRTEFGSQRTFWIERVQGEWLGVPAAELPNGELGWIHDDRDRLELLETQYSVTADVSERRLELRFGKQVLEDFSVTVGAPGSPTPPGSYSITDGLAGEGVGPYYGCCILALNGHQPNLPADWLGGDRIAIHGTPGETGLAASAGCLRASDVDMVSLFARLPLGAPVFIRA